MRSSLSSVTMFAFALAVLTGASLASGPGIPRGEKVFKRLDADNSGKLSVAEIQPRVERRFFRIDNDADGAVSTAEIDLWLKQMMERRRDRILSNIDGDKNGAITHAEFAAFVGIEFKKADTDRDGGVTLGEAQSYKFTKDDRLQKELMPDEDAE